ncbi:MAG TPA: hypothetical protein DDZ68_07510 [Parvularcula sp.]|nr:hypothetical protein [Parvularcula sp.]
MPVLRVEEADGARRPVEQRDLPLRLAALAARNRKTGRRRREILRQGDAEDRPARRIDAADRAVAAYGHDFIRKRIDIAADRGFNVGDRARAAKFGAARDNRQRPRRKLSAGGLIDRRRRSAAGADDFRRRSGVRQSDRIKAAPILMDRIKTISLIACGQNIAFRARAFAGVKDLDLARAAWNFERRRAGLDGVGRHLLRRRRDQEAFERDRRMRPERDIGDAGAGRAVRIRRGDLRRRRRRLRNGDRFFRLALTSGDEGGKGEGDGKAHGDSRILRADSRKRRRPSGVSDGQVSRYHIRKTHVFPL